jgi:hypothetical protein
VNKFLPAFFAFLVSISFALASDSGAEAWTETTWNGERVFVANSAGVEAIVSADRGRLVYFGLENEGRNFLFRPPSRRDPAGWGGHRVWLGPQTDWSKNWPPPAGWDAAPPERIQVDGSRLEFAMADAGDGWPRITRLYFWRDGKLHCDARMSGGSRPAQIIHIVQVPATTEAEMKAAPSPDVPRGYTQVHLGRGLIPVKQFPEPSQITDAAGKLRVKFSGKMDKFGFTPQPILARVEGGITMRIERGAETGQAISTPDEGFATQIYLGSARGPVIELEQLSPLFPAGTDASFEIIISRDAASGR